jgi:hypothetical protein
LHRDRPVLRTRTALAVVILVTTMMEPSAAFADETQAPEQAQHATELSLLRSMLWEPRPKGRLQYVLAATLDSGVRAGADSRRADLGASVAADLSLVKYCRHLNVGGHASLSYLVGAELLLSAEQWASVCLARYQFPLPGVEVGHHLRWRTSRRLASPLTDLRRTVSQETVYFYLSILEGRSNDNAQTLSLMPIRLDFHFHLEADRASFPEIETGAIRYSWERQPNRFELDAFSIRFRSNGEPASADVVEMELARGRLELGSVELHAELGWLFGALGTAETTTTTSHVDVDRDLKAFGAAASIAGTWGPVRLGASWARRMWPLPQQALVLEQRVTGWVRVRRPGWRWFVEAEGFTARSRVVEVLKERTDWTGGGELRWTYDLGRFIRLGLSVEAARSYYTAAGGDAGVEVDGAPRFGVRAGAFAAARLDSGQR